LTLQGILETIQTERLKIANGGGLRAGSEWTEPKTKTPAQVGRIKSEFFFSRKALIFFL